MVKAGVQALEHKADLWHAKTPAGNFQAPIVVNASGAWADTVGRMAGCKPVGGIPKRRTAFLFAPPEGVDVSAWPLTVDVEENFYFKPMSGVLMGSPADETPVEPHDAFADEMDIAIGADRIQTASTLEIRAIRHSWAGLRSFVADKRRLQATTQHRRAFSGSAARAAMASRPRRGWAKRRRLSRSAVKCRSMFANSA